MEFLKKVIGKKVLGCLETDRYIFERRFSFVAICVLKWGMGEGAIFFK